MHTDTQGHTWTHKNNKPKLGEKFTYVHLHIHTNMYSLNMEPGTIRPDGHNNDYNSDAV